MKRFKKTHELAQDALVPALVDVELLNVAAVQLTAAALNCLLRKKQIHEKSEGRGKKNKKLKTRNDE